MCEAREPERAYLVCLIYTHQSYIRVLVLFFNVYCAIIGTTSLLYSSNKHRKNATHHCHHLIFLICSIRTHPPTIFLIFFYFVTETTLFNLSVSVVVLFTPVTVSTIFFYFISFFDVSLSTFFCFCGFLFF
eukprot:m.115452 g.115452  ORF g.115452 m.115452 type:complete len:131 (-) comp9291_c2_seq1:2186-2578(-)